MERSSSPESVPAPWQPEPESMLSVAVRFGVYSLAVLACTASLPSLGSSRGIDFFRENGTLENAQAAILAVSAALFLWAARRVPEWKVCFWICAICAAVAFARELDSVFGAIIPHVGWAVPAAVIVAVGGRPVWKNRGKLKHELPPFLSHRVFALAWAGFIVAVPFAQLLGHGDFLEMLMGDDYHRHYKRVIEEITETMGYMLILAGSIEALFVGKRYAKRGG